MFARKFRVDVTIDGEKRPCPLDWLDKFFMRNFTGAAEFDDTLPVTNGILEAGLRVQPEKLASGLAEWLTKTGKAGGKKVSVEIHEEVPGPPAAPPAKNKFSRLENLEGGPTGRC